MDPALIDAFKRKCASAYAAAVAELERRVSEKNRTPSSEAPDDPEIKMSRGGRHIVPPSQYRHE